MSSLRLALKQSLAESGHLVDHQKREKIVRKKDDGTRKQRRRKPGDPPRKRGRPRKHPLPDSERRSSTPTGSVSGLSSGGPSSQDDEDGDARSISEGSFSSENEFSSAHESESDEDESQQQPALQTLNESSNGLFDSDHSSDDTPMRLWKEKRRQKQAMSEQQISAASKIQSQWKKMKFTAADVASIEESEVSPKPIKKISESAVPVTVPKLKETSAKRPGSSASSNVPPPSPELVAWMRNLSIKKQRRKISQGLRVKVRFATKVKKRDGKIVRRLKWYGGLVTAVSTGGSKIRIKYDDGTSEVSKFPDKDVIVDATGNGRHIESAAAFCIPPETIRETSSSTPRRSPLPPAPPDSRNSDQESDDNKTATLSIPPKSETPLSMEKETEEENETSAIGTSVQVRLGEKAIADSPSSANHTLENTITRSPERTTPQNELASASELKHSESRQHEQERPPQSDPSRKKSKPVDSHPDVVSASSMGYKHSDVSKPQSNATPSKPSLTIRLISSKSKRESILGSKGGKEFHSSEEERAGRGSDDDFMSMEVARTKFGNRKEERNPSWSAMSSVNDDDEGSAPQEKIFRRKKRPIEHSTDSSKEQPPMKKIDGRVKSDVYNIGDTDEVSRLNTTGGPSRFKLNKSAEGQSRDNGLSRKKQLKRLSQPTPSSDDDEDDFSHGLETSEQSLPTTFHKRKRDELDVAGSSKPARRSSGDRSPVPTNSPTPLATDPKAMASSAGLPRTVSAVATAMKFERSEEDNIVKEVQYLSSSKNSSFERTEWVSPDDAAETPRPSESFDSGAEDEMSLNKLTLPLQEEASSADDSVSKASAPIARSGRRAAQQANQRIAARQEMVIQDTYAKPKKKREKAELKLFPPSVNTKRKSRGDESGEEEEELPWVQCDSCQKWRVLPSSVQTDKLPKNWYCQMNVYDSLRNTCDAPEQTLEEIAKEKRKAKRRLARLARREAAEQLQSNTGDVEDVIVPKLEPPKKEKKLDRGRDRSITRSPFNEKKGSLMEKEDPPSKGDPASDIVVKQASPVSNVSGASGCQSPRSDEASDSQKPIMVKKQPSFNLTGVRKPRADDADDANSIGIEITSDSGLSKGKGAGKSRHRSRGSNANLKEAEKGKGGKKESKEADSQEWVQCEKCTKWRRLPPHISPDSLPENWYCTMNTWDVSSASCDAAEDKVDPNTREYGIYGSGANLIAPVTSNKLSYRNLIFGTGRKQNRPVSERTRAAESLFITPDDITSEGVGYPTVMYANSSVYISRGHNSKSNSVDDANRLSIFELMSHSNLWAELRGANKVRKLSSRMVPVECHSSNDDFSFDSLSEETRQAMKELVFHALGTGALAGHEVLLEAQCRQWEGIPIRWSEIRALCTFENVGGALLSLVKDGVVEIVNQDNPKELDALPQYRRVVFETCPALATKRNTEPRQSRCMKIAKPWKSAINGAGTRMA